ncbi:MAG: hypothetical protein GTN59_00160 [Candidatus Dadabacteria bacterium]|nr:hypothetical protein [Candidatus Dadabacteria bacterium]
MKRIQFTQEQIDRMIYLYTEEHQGTSTICKEFDCSKAVINRVLRKNGVELGSSGRKWTGGKSAANKRYQEKNKEKLSEYYKQWYQDNKEYRKQYHKQWREDNEGYKEYRREYEKNKKDSDPSYKLACYTRTAIYTCLKERNVDKYKNTFDLLPYTLEQLIEHLETQFQDGMSWDNYGDWHVDHIRPMNSFVINSPEDKNFQECWSLNNLQPLWGEENLSKGSTYL